MKTLSRDRDRAELIARVHGVRPESAARFGVLTAPEMILHCRICLEVGLGRCTPAPADRFVDRALIKAIALYMPFHWPKGVATRPEMDVRRNGMAPGQFVHDVASLVERIEEFSSSRLGARHPIFGPMSQSEWLRWGYLHTDHHLRQFGS